ncbi:hypothetical protein [Rhodospirillaceae bacterium SYSU D60014]|uniref:hypothetical protein n=1 Tax=Virgifigura deserti TaxID=2268457 RepID=UPI000E669CE0
MNLGSLSIDLAPLLPWPAIGVLGLAALLMLGLALFRRARGVAWRFLAVAVLMVALLNPSLVREQREALDDVAVVLVDESPSQEIEERTAETEAALAEVERQLRTFDNVEVRIVRAGGPETPAGAAAEGTQLFDALTRALADVPSRRVAGVVVITDGQVHDVPADLQELGFDAPVHALLSGRADEGDRRLMVTEAPSYGIVNKEIAMTVRVDDLRGEGLPDAEVSGLAQVTVTQDGEPLDPLSIPIGVDYEILLELEHGGPTVFEIAVEQGPRELSLVNNSAVVMVNGVRDRLRVLLVSGEPHAGERTWRNLLKSDPAVDLVHFTILRPPEKQDGTPIDELSLIAFPIRELFEIKLDEFDLIIFDRYRRRGVLPRAYFENIARYVEEGGALLVSSGSTLAGPFGLYQSPLGRVLPGEPSGDVVEQGFRPGVTVIGRRHPVTADLPGIGSPGGAPETSGGDESPSWGRWFMQIEASARRGETVLDGANGLPLLILDRFGDGRVAQLLSDQIWLWSRGFEGGGPQGELLRRIAHWLMKEPELEEEDLKAMVIDGRIEITRRSLTEHPETVEVTTPTGKTLTVPLSDAGDGRAVGSLPAAEPGLYRISDGTRMAFAASGALNPLEFADLRASGDLLQPIADQTGGSVRRLAEEDVPSLRQVGPDRDAAGPGWIGLQRNQDYLVTGIRQVPLLPALVILLLGLGATLLAWRREGR